jgi:hypothetical protein
MKGETQTDTHREKTDRLAIYKPTLIFLESRLTKVTLSVTCKKFNNFCMNMNTTGF